MFSRVYCIESKFPNASLMFTKSTLNTPEPDSYVCCLPESHICHSLTLGKTMKWSEEALAIGEAILSQRQGKIKFDSIKFSTVTCLSLPIISNTITSISNTTTTESLSIQSCSNVEFSIGTVTIPTESISISTTTTAFDNPRRKGKESNTTGLFKYFFKILKQLKM